MKGLFAFN